MKKMLSELKHKFNIISFLFFIICGCGAGLPPFSPSSPFLQFLLCLQLTVVCDKQQLFTLDVLERIFFILLIFERLFFGEMELKCIQFENFLCYFGSCLANYGQTFDIVASITDINHIQTTCFVLTGLVPANRQMFRIFSKATNFKNIKGTERFQIIIL